MKNSSAVLDKAILETPSEIIKDSVNKVNAPSSALIPYIIVSKIIEKTLSEANEATNLEYIGNSSNVVESAASTSLHQSSF